MKRNQLISRTRVSNLILLFVGGLGSLIIAYFMIANSFSVEYPQVVGFVFGCIFAVIGFVSLYYLLFSDKLLLTKNSIQFISLFGKLKRSIEYSDIISYSEIQKENKYYKWTDLILFTTNSKFKIHSTSYYNYEEIKNVLIKGKKQNRNAQNEWEYKNNQKLGIGFSIIGCLFLLWFGNVFINRDELILSSELSQFKGTISKQIEIIKSGKNKQNLSIPIEIEEYPKFKFVLAGFNLQSTNSSQLIKNVKIGDQVQIQIRAEQFKKKLTQEIPLKYWDKSLNYRNITIYGFEDKNHVYFNLDWFNRLKKEDQNSNAMYFLLGISIFILGSGIYLLLEKQES